MTTPYSDVAVSNLRTATCSPLITLEQICAAGIENSFILLFIIIVRYKAYA